MIHTFVPKVRGQAFHLHFQLSETHEARGREGVGMAELPGMHIPLPKTGGIARCLVLDLWNGSSPGVVPASYNLVLCCYRNSLTF